MNIHEIFLEILNMSVTSSYVILFVIVLRFLLKKAPKIFSYSLWGIAFFRLVCPFSFESVLSLIPTTKPIPEEALYSRLSSVQTGIPIVDTALSIRQPFADSTLNPVWLWVEIGFYLWFFVMMALVIYSICSVVKLSRSLKNATHINDNIYEAENLKTPFVLGFITPKIYLPTGLSETQTGYILKHEQMHIKRLDYIIKPLAFIVLCVHWFNPLVWLAFFLMGTDMELSCDESVIKQLGNDVKKDYSASLLSLSVGKRILNGCPLAFGEGNAKNRIKNVLNYKKPRFWVVTIAVIAVITLAVCLIANPKTEKYGFTGVMSYKEGDKFFICEDKPETSEEELIYQYFLYDVKGEFDKKAKISPTEPDYVTQNSYDDYSRDEYTNYNFHSFSTFSESDTEDFSREIEENKLVDYKIVQAVYTLEYSPARKAKGPQYAEDKSVRNFLVGKSMSEKKPKLYGFGMPYFAEDFESEKAMDTTAPYLASAEKLKESSILMLMASDFPAIRALMPALNPMPKELIKSYSKIEIKNVEVLREDVREDKAVFEFSVKVKSAPNGLGMWPVGISTHYLYAEKCEIGWYIESFSGEGRSQAELEEWWNASNIFKTSNFDPNENPKTATEVLIERLQDTLNQIDNIEASNVEVSEDKKSVIIELQITENAELSDEQNKAIIKMVKAIGLVDGISEEDIEIVTVADGETDIFDIMIASLSEYPKDYFADADFKADRVFVLQRNKVLANKALWDNFLKALETPDEMNDFSEVTIVYNTVEGDAIFIKLLHNRAQFYAVTDRSRDKFKDDGNDYHKMQYKYMKIFDSKDGYKQVFLTNDKGLTSETANTSNATELSDESAYSFLFSYQE